MLTFGQSTLWRFIYFLLLLSILGMIACQPDAQKKNVVQLETYLIYAREDGQPANMPILPGELSVNYVSALFENTEKVYDNLKDTYGYDVFWLKGQTRDLLLFGGQEQEISTQLDTFHIRLSYQNRAVKAFVSLRMLSGYRQPKEILNTKLGFSIEKTIVLGIGQPKGDKRSALFLILHPQIRQIATETDVESLSDFVLGDLIHQLQLYRLQKQLRHDLNLPAKRVEDFENVYEFFKVTQKPRLTQKAKPDYPEKALKAGAEGTVVVSVVIREDGCVGKALVFLTRNFDLDSSAIAAAKRCIFTPGEVSGKKVKTIMNIPFRFRLKGTTKGTSSVIGHPFTNDMHITKWPQLLNKIEPQLPKNFDQAQLPDWNIVQVLIDKQGAVRATEIVKEAKNKTLDQISLNTAKQLRFTPGKIEGVVKEMRMQIPFKYTKNEEAL